MEAKEIRIKSQEELFRNLAEERESLRRARFELAQGRVKNIRMIRKTRRHISRILTVLGEKRSKL